MQQLPATPELVCHLHAEAFLDQVITWREVGANAAFFLPNYTSYTSLPEWAKTTLAEHADDPREYTYTRKQFELAGTHDELWEKDGSYASLLQTDEGELDEDEVLEAAT